MVNDKRYNVRNKAMSEANTKLILASLKAGPKTITDLMIVTGMTRVTVTKKLTQNSDVIGHNEEHPKRYFIKGEDYSTVIDETVKKNAPQKKGFDAVKEAIVHGTVAAPTDPNTVRFYPKYGHNELSNFHDQLIDADPEKLPLYKFYQSIKSNADLDKALQMIKMMHDTLHFRKTLKEFE